MSTLFDALKRKQFSEQQRISTWTKCRAIQGYDPAVWRLDSCGAVIAWNGYGDTNSQHGWEIDHIHPVARGGSDHPNNLQALQWQNNRAKGDSVMGFVPAVGAIL